MVSETILLALGAALISGSSAVAASGVTAYINRQNTQDQIEAQQTQLESRLNAEDRRRRAEYYLEPKVEAMTDLYGQLHYCRYRYRVADDMPPESMDRADLEEIIEFSRRFQVAMETASAFLSAEQNEVIEKFYGNLIEANTYFQKLVRETQSGEWPISVDDRTKEMWDRMELFQLHDEAREVLKQEIYEPLRDFESI